MSAFNTADEREASPIGALYPFIQHRKPECATSCVCGAREAVVAVEQAIGAADRERGFTNAEFWRFVAEAKDQRERAERAEASLVEARAEAHRLHEAVEHMDTKMTRLSADGEFVTMYQVMAGPWHRVLGLARGALALDESPSALVTEPTTPATPSPAGVE